MVQIGIGNVILNTGNLYGHPLAVQDAVSLALFFMVADQGANDAQGIVVEEHFTGFGTVSLQEQANHLRDVGLDRTAVVAAGRLFALQAAPGLVYYVDSHDIPPDVNVVYLCIHCMK